MKNSFDLIKTYHIQNLVSSENDVHLVDRNNFIFINKVTNLSEISYFLFYVKRV